MGPNGSGKSTLSAVIAGDENYDVDDGSILLENEDLLELDPDERAHKGVFLSFQYPVEIPGISVSNFMKAAINEKRLFIKKYERGFFWRREKKKRNLSNGNARA